MEFEWLESGSIRIKRQFVPSERFLQNWQQDENDPMVFHPKYQPCDSRKFEFVLLNCGRKAGRYSCSTGATVTPATCRECQTKQ